jgi:hypothetical protein
MLAQQPKGQLQNKHEPKKKTKQTHTHEDKIQNRETFVI